MNDTTGSLLYGSLGTGQCTVSTANYVSYTCYASTFTWTPRIYTVGTVTAATAATVAPVVTAGTLPDWTAIAESNAFQYGQYDQYNQFYFKGPSVISGTSIPALILTPEELAEMHRVAAEAEERETIAAACAEDLLLSMLTQAQRESYKKDKQFDLVVRGRLYRLRHERRVQLIENDKPVCSFCIVPEHGLPAGDVLLAQKLLLEHDESKFLKIANVFDTPVGENPVVVAPPWPGDVSIEIELAA